MANFTWTPDFQMQETPEFHTLVSTFETGHEQRRNKWANPIRKWVLNFSNRSKADFAAVEAFFIARKGAYEAFTWTNPNDSVTYTVRFDGDSFKSVLKAFELYDFECKFIEVR